MFSARVNPKCRGSEISRVILKRGSSPTRVAAPAIHDDYLMLAPHRFERALERRPLVLRDDNDGDARRCRRLLRFRGQPNQSTRKPLVQRLMHQEAETLIRIVKLVDVEQSRVRGT